MFKRIVSFKDNVRKAVVMNDIEKVNGSRYYNAVNRVY